MACHVGMKLLRIQFPATCQELLQKTGLWSQTKNKVWNGSFWQQYGQKWGGFERLSIYQSKNLLLETDLWSQELLEGNLRSDKQPARTLFNMVGTNILWVLAAWFLPAAATEM